MTQFSSSSFVIPMVQLLTRLSSYLEVSVASSYQEIRFFSLGLIKRVFIQL